LPTLFLRHFHEAPTPMSQHRTGISLQGERVMNESQPEGKCSWTRREFLQSTVAAVSAMSLPVSGAAAERNEGAFTPEAGGFKFDTGSLQGVLRNGGKSRGLQPLMDVPTGSSVARGAGVFSHYRLLDSQARYGVAAWEWPSQAELLDDGTVQARWHADAAHPFDLTATYRWTTPRTLDVTTVVVAQRDLRRFESFLASYFDGFATSLVYVKTAVEGKPAVGFFEARKSHAVWQMFPRDMAAVKMIRDGRWKREPHPVEWWIAPELAAPLAMRRDSASGLAGIVMAPPDDCFAIATPYGEEGHRSLYLSLFGKDLKAGEPATARARLVIARDVTDAQVIELYDEYLASL
jgi:hypothetical protein